jgi:hypothetical protein
MESTEDTPEKPSSTFFDNSKLSAFRRTIAFLVGILLVVFGITDACPRIGAIAVGLLMMGVFSVPEAIGVIRGTNTK